MSTFRELLNEETYKEFFAKKLEKFGVSSPSELSDEDKKKLFDEVDAEWKGKKETDEACKKKAKKKVLKEGMGISSVQDLIADLEDHYTDMSDTVNDFESNFKDDFSDAYDLLDKLDQLNLTDYRYADSAREIESMAKSGINYGFDDYEDEAEREAMEELLHDVKYYAEDLYAVIQFEKEQDLLEQVKALLDGFETRLRKL